MSRPELWGDLVALVVALDHDPDAVGEMLNSMDCREHIALAARATVMVDLLLSNAGGAPGVLRTLLDAMDCRAHSSFILLEASRLASTFDGDLDGLRAVVARVARESE